MRLFVSIDMPEKVCEVAVAAQQYLKRRNLFEGTYTDSAHAHMTVAFLADVDEAHLSDIDAALCTVEPPNFQAHTGALDYFARGDQVKIIFLSIICPPLVQFVERVQAVLIPACAKAAVAFTPVFASGVHRKRAKAKSGFAGLAPDRRPFHPHITLARVKHSQDYEKFRHELVGYVVPRIDFVIDRFHLKESVLTSAGPIHTIRTSYPCIK